LCRIELVFEKPVLLAGYTRKRSHSNDSYSSDSPDNLPGHTPGHFDAVQVLIDEFKASCINFSAGDDREAGRESGFSSFSVKVEQEFE
jgi:hypothetical protein